MTNMFSIFVSVSLAFWGQVYTSIPEVPLRLARVYPSSRQEATKLSAPTAMAIAPSGNIYVFDDGNSRIVKLSRNGTFIAQFGEPGSGQSAIQRGGLSDSIAVDQKENVYIGNSVTPKVQVFTSNGRFVRSFRVPFPVTSIAVNTKREIYVAVTANSPTKLVLVFSETGKFLRQIGERLVSSNGRLARSLNKVVIACDLQDNLYLAFRSWPVIRKYSAGDILVGEQQFEVPSYLVSESQRKNFSLDFIGKNADTSFVLPLLTHSIAVTGARSNYLLLNAHSVIVFDSNCKVLRHFHFRAPRDRDNLFIGVASAAKSRSLHFLDNRSGEIYEALKL